MPLRPDNQRGSSTRKASLSRPAHHQRQARVGVYLIAASIKVSPPSANPLPVHQKVCTHLESARFPALQIGWQKRELSSSLKPSALGINARFAERQAENQFSPKQRRCLQKVKRTRTCGTVKSRAFPFPFSRSFQCESMLRSRQCILQEIFSFQLSMANSKRF